MPWSQNPGTGRQGTDELPTMLFRSDVIHSFLLHDHAGQTMLSGQTTQVLLTAEELFDCKILGIYLYGSATMGRLRPDSDLDILILIEQHLDARERKFLTERLLALSVYPACAEKRPLEVTVLSKNDIVPWKFPPKCEYMYGEWLRHDMEKGIYPQAYHDPDVAILLWQAQKKSLTLKGADIKDIVPLIPFADIKKAIRLCLPTLIAAFAGDERNVLLTLARMWYTIKTEEVATKDVAAQWALSRIPKNISHILETAREAYLGKAHDDWKEIGEDKNIVLLYLKEQIEHLLMNSSNT